MASADEGYEDDRFQSPVPQNFHCAICLNVLKKPMQCVRNEHSFCKPCITRHLQTTPRCPTCIEPLTLATLRPSRVVTDLLSQLMIRCDNFHRECPESVKMEMLEAHVQNCEFSPVHCSNDGCEVIISRKDQADHEINDCDHRQGKCEVCGKQVAYRKRQLHCYVTRNEVDEMKRDFKETKDEVSDIKDIVMNLSRELTRHMGDMKGHMGDMKGQMGDMKKQMNAMEGKIREINCEMTAKRSSPAGLKRDVIIAGGYNEDTLLPLQTVEWFSWTTRQWTLLPAMTSARSFSSSFVHRGHMYVCGGLWSDSMEVLQLGQDGARWRNFPAKLPHKIHGHTCVVYEDMLFIFGGESDGKVTNDIYEILLVAPYSSQVVGHMPKPRAYHGAQCFGDKVFIVGGTTTTTTGDSNVSLNTVLVYDITSNNYCRTLPPLPFVVCKMATVAWKDNIILLGGQDKNGNALNTVVKYNVTNEKSEMLPAMKHKRLMCSAVITGNMIIVMGGFNKEERSLKSAECFNLELYTWEELAPMKTKINSATAAVVQFF